MKRLTFNNRTFKRGKNKKDVGGTLLAGLLEGAYCLLTGDIPLLLVPGTFGCWDSLPARSLLAVVSPGVLDFKKSDQLVSVETNLIY